MAKVKWYTTGDIKEASGSYSFLKRFIKSTTLTTSDKKEVEYDIKSPGCLFDMTGCMYNIYTSHNIIIVIFILIILASSEKARDYVGPYLTRDTLTSILQVLATLMAIFTAIVVAFGNMHKSSKIILWKNYFVHYFRYIFIIIVLDLILLVLPDKLLDFIRDYDFVFSALSVGVLWFNIYGIFLVIKATEKYFDANV